MVFKVRETQAYFNQHHFYHFLHHFNQLKSSIFFYRLNPSRRAFTDFCKKSFIACFPTRIFSCNLINAILCLNNSRLTLQIYGKNDEKFGTTCISRWREARRKSQILKNYDVYYLNTNNKRNQHLYKFPNINHPLMNHMHVFFINQTGVVLLKFKRKCLMLHKKINRL